MGFTVVTIERQTGAGAEKVAALVATGLHYQLLDAEIVRRAAAAAGVSTETIEHSEHVPSFFERILSGLALAGFPDTPTDPTQLGHAHALKSPVEGTHRTGAARVGDSRASRHSGTFRPDGTSASS